MLRPFLPKAHAAWAACAMLAIAIAAIGKYEAFINQEPFIGK